MYITSQLFTTNKGPIYIAITGNNPNLKTKNNLQLNNDGFINFDANLEKMSKYNFKTISSFSNFEPEILLDKDQLFYFDSNGSIIKFKVFVSLLSFSFFFTFS